MSTRELVAEVINGIAKRGICDLGDDFDKQSAEEKAKRIAAVAAWGQKLAGKSEADLIVEVLQERYAQGGEFWDYDPRLIRLVELKDKRLVPLIVKALDDKANLSRRGKILELLVEFDPTVAQAAAKGLLTDPNIQMRVRAAIVLHGDEREKSRAILGEFLAKVNSTGGPGDDADTLLQRSIETLLGDGTPESYLLRLYAKSKSVEPYRFYLSGLDIEGNQFAGISFGDPVRERFVGQICDQFGHNDDAIAKIAADYPKPLDRVPAIKKLFAERIAEIEAIQKK
jgi:hypothetical protein